MTWPELFSRMIPVDVYTEQNALYPSDGDFRNYTQWLMKLHHYCYWKSQKPNKIAKCIGRFEKFLKFLWLMLFDISTHFLKQNRTGVLKLTMTKSQNQRKKINEFLLELRNGIFWLFFQNKCGYWLLILSQATQK